ncbi:MAG TPA: gamma-glutamyl-gamma-aminobutyrate hydrolase family protein [Rubrivivax sp.]|nr:gamma-glutamyl-gamma-aminobutyrate hydrolase family protein [Rubrivivax sp.]
MSRPIVLVPACNQLLGGYPTHTVKRQYVEAVRLAGALPMVVPWLEAEEIDSALDAVHGVLLTGSPSNVGPCNYGEAVHDPTLPLDPQRDAWTLPLARRALARGLPLLAICRGAQEVNVALGGSLHQAVQEVPDMDDHRDDPTRDRAEQWGPAHPVNVVPGGVIEQLLGAGSFAVNSLHGQGVKRLAPGLRIEAVAPDGLVEAFSVESPNGPKHGFNLCVQWHPEWQARDNPVSMRLLQAFGSAVRAYHDERRETASTQP